VISDFVSGSFPKEKLSDTSNEPEIVTFPANEVSLTKSLTSSTCFLGIILAISYSSISVIFPLITKSVLSTSVGIRVMSSLNINLISFDPLAY
jgi:hypothetical protein